jgi:L-lysine exporter family protein LysE/ArgO
MWRGILQNDADSKSAAFYKTMPEFFLVSALQGAVVGASLIIAFGPQNAFVLRQGLARRHMLATALVCSLCDGLLILIGVAGLGTLISQSPALIWIATWGGVLYLLWYGLYSLRQALRPSTLVVSVTGHPLELRNSMLTALGLSLLNPHVYLDTVVLLGSIGGQLPPAQRPSFASGAMLSSFLWFFSVVFGAAKLAPLFRQPLAWRLLDVVVGLAMWGIAISLLVNVLP